MESKLEEISASFPLGVLCGPLGREACVLWEIDLWLPTELQYCSENVFGVSILCWTWNSWLETVFVLWKCLG